MWNRSSSSSVEALRLLPQIHLQVFRGHPKVYNGLVQKGKVSVLTIKYHQHIDVSLWAVPQHFPFSNNNKMRLTVNYAEPQLLQFTGMEWSNWEEQIILAKCNWGVEISTQLRSCPSLLFPILSWCHSLAREDYVLSFSAQGSTVQGWVDRHCPLSLVKTCYSSTDLCGRKMSTFSGEQYLFQNTSSYSAVGSLRVFVHFPTFAPRFQLI